MKKIVLSLVLSSIMIASFAQSEKYTKAMKEKVVAVDTTRTPDQLKDLSAAFERIGDAEKTQWLPYYYAALTQVNSGLYVMAANNGSLTADKADPIADKAEELLNKAESLSKDNSEIYVVKKLIINLRMAPGEMSRYMKYGPEGATALETAKKLNPNNPRVYLLEAEDKWFTPEQYGGSHTEAKKIFEQAIKMFESFKPATDLDPAWGKPTAQYFISQN
jgi:hypothetical protein